MPPKAASSAMPAGYSQAILDTQDVPRLGGGDDDEENVNQEDGDAVMEDENAKAAEDAVPAKKKRAAPKSKKNPGSGKGKGKAAAGAGKGKGKTPRKPSGGSKSARKRENKDEVPLEEKGKRKHRFRPGTVALRQIKFYQKSDKLLLPKLSFQRLVREVAQDFKNDLRFQAKAILALQEATEARLVEMFQAGVFQMAHRGRVTVTDRDIRLANHAKGDLALSGSSTV